MKRASWERKIQWSQWFSRSIICSLDTWRGRENFWGRSEILCSVVFWLSVGILSITFTKGGNWTPDSFRDTGFLTIFHSTFTFNWLQTVLSTSLSSISVHNHIGPGWSPALGNFAVSIHGLPNTKSPCYYDDLLGGQCASPQGIDHDFPNPVMTVLFHGFSALHYSYE